MKNILRHDVSKKVDAEEVWQRRAPPGPEQTGSITEYSCWQPAWRQPLLPSSLPRIDEHERSILAFQLKGAKRRSPR